jgi:hypothetical protein
MALSIMSSLKADVAKTIDSLGKVKFDFLQNVTIAFQTHL